MYFRLKTDGISFSLHLDIKKNLVPLMAVAGQRLTEPLARHREFKESLTGREQFPLWERLVLHRFPWNPAELITLIANSSEDPEKEGYSTWRPML